MSVVAKSASSSVPCGCSVVLWFAGTARRPQGSLLHYDGCWERSLLLVQAEDVLSTEDATLGWAWVAGASEGLGLAFATVLAERGYSLVLFARRESLLEEIGQTLAQSHGVQVATHALDMASSDLAEVWQALLEQHPPIIGIYNAAFAPVGEFLQRPVADLTQAVTVNAQAPLVFCHVLGRAMQTGGGGGLVLMSSLAGMQGAPRIAAYSATKAFNNTLGEALWSELRAHNIRVVTCVAGAVQTPGYESTAQTSAPGTLAPREVAQRTLAALRGKNRGALFVPGWVNRLAYFLLGRWLPRKWAIAIMARSTSNLRSDD